MPDNTWGPLDTLAQGIVVSVMWTYAATVLYPARAFLNAGLARRTAAIGSLPKGLPDYGLGPLFSREFREPVFLQNRPKDADLVDGFNRSAEIYDFFCQPFSRPIFDAALREMAAYLLPDSRVLDAGCGPGRELRYIANLVPKGEVVGIDLSKEMVRVAHRDACRWGISNVAFFQSDVADLPERFCGQFDLAFSTLAHHHYSDPAAAGKSILRCLRSEGVYCVVDAGPEWFNRIADPLAKFGDPGFIHFLTPQEFRSLFTMVGFQRTAWIDLLPGFGMAVGQK